MSAQVVTFSGGIKGGKSSVSREVASQLGWPRVSFGDEVRSVSRSRGLDANDRAVLQTVGQDLVNSDSRAFCRAVLAQAASAWAPGKNLIIDGLRHVEVADALRNLVEPSCLRIVLIDAELAIRASRAHGQEPVEDLARWEQHPTEAQVARAIPAIADLIIDGSEPFDAVVRRVVAWIQERNC